jgi:hypothetical protein
MVGHPLERGPMLDEKSAIKLIKLKFMDLEKIVLIPLLEGGYFSARWTKDGIMVDNLGFYPMLPWEVFVEAVNFLKRKSGRAEKGDLYSIKLGDDAIPLDSIEGHVAQTVYGKKKGDVILRRIEPLSSILVWAEVCDDAQDELILR